LVECWINGELARPTQGWLEIMQGEHPQSVDGMWADEAVNEGRDIAKNIIGSTQEVC
jgi:hypothetical protein